MQCSNYFLFSLIWYAVAGISLMYEVGQLDATISHMSITIVNCVQRCSQGAGFGGVTKGLLN